MSLPLIENAFAAGELTPGLFGRVDLAKFHIGAATMRNLFVSYRGGAYSRAGTAFVGYSKQTGRTVPPRMITFQFSINQGLALEFGNNYMRVVDNGEFVTETPENISMINQALPMQINVANNWQAGDWIFVSGVAGMTQVNDQTYVVASATSGYITLNDVFGNPVNSTGFSIYTGGGTAARIYTLTTPYAEADLEYLKFTQSADVMTLCCWNQVTGTSYPPMQLTRFADNNWTLAQPQIGTTISPPTGYLISSVGAGETPTWNFSYVVTSIASADGQESIASPPITKTNTGNPALVANSITLNWNSNSAASTYKVYRALGTIYPVSDSTAADVPVGSLFGFIGSTYGTTFTDSNITADYSQVPPTHQNPFSPGAIIAVPITSQGSGYSQSTVQLQINTATGSGAKLVPVIANGKLSAIIIQEAGQNYLSTDTVTILNGTGGAANITVGPSTGTYPSVPAYFQERLVYAGSPNKPDTYWMSQPGAYNNFDSRIPTIASDAITGTPWSVEVNGIQFMVNMPGGLVVLTGLSAWQLTGAGGSSLNPQPLTPSNQQAQPQAYNGCSATVPPIKIDLNILYVQAKGSIVRNIEYQIFQNQYFGADITVLSAHLFNNHQIREWAWCEEPYKILWAVRDDGVLLSLTYLKQQDIIGWARHDTHGLFCSVCAVTEPPVDALYLATQRFPTNTGAAYMIERMDNRLWNDVENSWCVDAALQYPQGQPNATLTTNSATGLGQISGFSNLVGGSNYSANTKASIVDNNGLGPGTGAVVTLTITNGVITNIASTPGSKYFNPVLVIYDPLGAMGGSGASATPILNNSANFYTTSNVFTPVMAQQGWVIRIGGGIATITEYISPTEVIGNITTPITGTCPNGTFVVPATPGEWTLTQPTIVVSGLNHLAGSYVTGVADGNVIPPQAVSAQGTITLSVPATAITVGMGYQVQLQSVYLDSGNPTVQGQRKKIAAVTARLENSGNGITIGTNQPDGSVQSPAQIQTLWQNMVNANVKSVPPFGSNVYPLYTGDIRIPTKGGYNTKGQVALQQLEPLPMQVLALVPEFDQGDVPQPPGPQAAQGRGK